LGGAEPAVDMRFCGLVRRDLPGGAWVEHCPAWLAGADVVFGHLLGGADWRGHDRVMFGERVREPRLRASYSSVGPVAVLEQAAGALSERYGVTFDSIGLNLYRDGRDSVAWHGDRIPPSLEEPLVATCSLGAARRFLLRPRGGGRSVAFTPGPGDLIVMGGTAQRTWQHTVPKVAGAGPRISVTFRHWPLGAVYRSPG
jgi:hypothetical protein